MVMIFKNVLYYLVLAGYGETCSPTVGVSLELQKLEGGQFGNTSKTLRGLPTQDIFPGETMKLI